MHPPSIPLQPPLAEPHSLLPHSPSPDDRDDPPQGERRPVPRGGEADVVRRQGPAVEARAEHMSPGEEGAEEEERVVQAGVVVAHGHQGSPCSVQRGSQCRDVVHLTCYPVLKYVNFQLFLPTFFYLDFVERHEYLRRESD